MRFCFLPIVASLPLLAAVPAHAQEHDEQLWLQLNTNVPVADGVRVTLEQIGRFSDRQEGLYQTEFGAILGVQAAKGIELGFGYRRVDFHNANMARGEHRLRQHVVASFGAFTTRLRVDERFYPDDDEIGFRIRPLIRYNLKLSGTRVVPFYSHESFIMPNTTTWGQRAGYERMRNIVGVGVPVARGMSADIGYLNQFRPGRSGARDQMEHALTVQMTINLGDITGPHIDD